jgi:hypothetical protein
MLMLLNFENKESRKEKKNTKLTSTSAVIRLQDRDSNWYQRYKTFFFVTEGGSKMALSTVTRDYECCAFALCAIMLKF